MGRKNCARILDASLAMNVEAAVVEADDLNDLDIWFVGPPDPAPDLMECGLDVARRQRGTVMPSRRAGCTDTSVRHRAVPAATRPAADVRPGRPTRPRTARRVHPHRAPDPG